MPWKFTKPSQTWLIYTGLCIKMPKKITKKCQMRINFTQDSTKLLDFWLIDWEEMEMNQLNSATSEDLWKPTSEMLSLNIITPIKMDWRKPLMIWKKKLVKLKAPETKLKGLSMSPKVPMIVLFLLSETGLDMSKMPWNLPRAWKMSNKLRESAILDMPLLNNLTIYKKVPKSYHTSNGYQLQLRL